MNSEKPRKTVYVHLEQIFSNAGYWITRCHKTRWHILALLWIACNQIAAGKNTTARRVYQSICILFNRTMRGSRWYPNQIHSIWANAQRGNEVEVGHVDSVRQCPCCGQELPEELMTPPDPSQEDVEKAFQEHVPTKITTVE